jgi:hypothetical protein
MTDHRLHRRATEALDAALASLRDAAASLRAATVAERADADPSDQRAVGALVSLTGQVERAAGAAGVVRDAYAEEPR